MIVAGYRVLLKNSKEKCSGNSIDFRKQGENKETCSSLCNAEITCMYFFISTYGYCGLFKKCDGKMTTTFFGTIYERIIEGSYFISKSKYSC